MTLLLRLAVGSGRSSAARMLLVVLGTALSAALLLVAAGLLTIERSETSISGGSGFTIDADGRMERFDDPGSDGPLRNPYLVEPELRRGVAMGVVLCVVPLLVFVATASRVAARRRDERLAGLRLAGATDTQVRLLAALDTGVGTAVGAALGAVGFLVARVVVTSRADGQLRDLAVILAPPLALGAALLVGLLLALAAGAALALRAVQITPLAVARRAPRRRPRPWGSLLLVTGIASFAGIAYDGAEDSLAGDAALGLSLAAALLGLVACGPWITSLTGRVVARFARGPVLLLAGRRLEDEPRAQARAMSAVVLVSLTATIGLVVLADVRRSGAGPVEGTNRLGFLLAGAGVLFSLVVGASGLLLTTLEGLVERRRTTAALVAGGVPVSVLRRAVLVQVALPVLPATLLAVTSGLVTVAALFGSEQLPPIPWWSLAAVPVVAVLASALAAAATLPALRRTVSETQLRTT